MARAGFISFFFSIIFVWYIIGRIRLFWRRYNMKGRLFGVGVGPGDPELMTYKAVRTIEKCPVIAVDRKSTRLNSSHKVQSRMPSSA